MRTLELRTPAGAVLRCRLANGFGTRFMGLMGRAGLPEGEGLLLVPGGSVHTFFMRFAMDAVFVRDDGTVLRVTPAVKPWRLAGAPRGTRFVLELEGGRAAAYGLVEGAVLDAGDPGWEALGRRRRR